MTRLILRRLAVIPPALLLVNFLGYTYTHLVLPIRAARIPYFFASLPGSEPLLPAYASYLQGALRLEFGTLPGGEETIATAISSATSASLGLLVLAVALSILAGLLLGLRAVRSEPRGVSRWLTLLSTVGLGMPSFYIGTLLIMAIFSLRGSVGASFPLQGFGWDRHLVLPTLALMVQPTVQIAQVTAALLEGELGKRYILAARSVGYPWHRIRWRHALRNILAPVILTIAGSVRLLMGELILVEWLLAWPGLGRLFALALVPGRGSGSLGSELFLNPPVVATVVTAFAALFLVTDLIAAVLVQVVDPRLRVPEEGTGSADVVSSHSGSVRRNWPLLLGGLTVLLVVVLAIAGPSLAPHDPLKEHIVVKVDDRWEMKPFPALTVPGFPLGSDSRGRDLLSRLLWAVRPTMIMVAIVASVRLVLGTLIGLASGWSTGWVERVLDATIAGALSVPILMVALGAIAAVGIEIGLLAFLIGLSVTGWAQTAKIVREQTRLVKGQQYIEAARALGQSDFWILLRHVLRQVMPMVWMLLSLEISGTLMTTAGLGFLGYYIGGDIWVEVEDFVAQRFSGMPELGQMLATSNVGIASLGLEGLPLAMAAVGTMIFVIVLGFTLLGEGLRRRLSPERVRRRTIFSQAAGRVGPWIEEKVLLPVAGWVRGHAVHTAVAGLLLLIIGGGMVWWQARTLVQPEESGVELVIPGGHLWAGERRDPYGTLWSEEVGPTNPEVRWVFEDPSGFSGGPVVSADGTIYVASKGGTLYTLEPNGNLLWQATLPAVPVGVPALSAEGDLYVADTEGGLSAFSPGGALRWRFQSEAETLATAGPVVAPGGTIYYPVGGNIQAVSPDGESLWMARASSEYPVVTPRLSPTGEWLFWEKAIFEAKDGSPQELEMPVDADQYIVGADGRTYLRAGHNIMEWRGAASGAEIVETTRWDSRRLGTLTTPADAGVTREGVVWLFYTNPFEGTRIVWLDTSGRVLGVIRHPVGGGPMIGVDGGSTIHVCEAEPSPECLAFAPGSEEPIWQVSLEKGERAQGGALVAGRLYVTFVGREGGFLYAIGEPDQEVASVMTPAPDSEVKPTAEPASEPPASELPPSDVEGGVAWHTVQQGETLSSIARHYGTTWRAIAQANSLRNPSRIYVDQRLRIPTAGGFAGEPMPSCRSRHTVKRGEWVWQIARNYGVSPYDILAANGLTIETANTIYPGMVLCIP